MKRTLSERLYRVRRKIRYLYRRGTLFRKRPKQKKTGPGIIRRLYRFNRYLVVNGSLFRVKKQNSNVTVSTPISQPRAVYTLISEITPERARLTGKEKLVLYYRYLHFIFSTGKIFTRKIKKIKQRKKNKFLQFLRISGYLARHGKLFRIQNKGGNAFFFKRSGFLFTSDYLTILFNSTILFLLAYLVEFLFYYFSMALAGVTLNMRSVIHYYDIDFLVRSRDWSSDAVKIIYSAGPFISFILCLITIVIYFTFCYERWTARLFIFWLFCHAFTHSFGEVLTGALLSQRFGYVIMYMFLMDTAKVIISIAMIVILVLTGIIFTRIFLFSGNIYFNNLRSGNRMPFVYSQFIIPFLLGTGIIILLKIPGITAIDIITSCTMAVFLFPFAGHAKSTEDIYFDEEPRKVRIFWWWFFITLPLLVLFRIVFGIGIRM